MHQPGPSGDLERYLRAGTGGDDAAFAELYDAVAPTVYGLALRIIGGVQAAEEVTQEVLVEVCRTAALYDPAHGSALSWVLTKAHRKAVDRVRSAAVIAGQPDDRTIAWGQGDPGATQTAWQHLPTDQRRTLELAYFGGHTHSEIGQLLSLPLDTAQNRIRDGLLMLTRLLEPGPGKETAG